MVESGSQDEAIDAIQKQWNSYLEQSTQTVETWKAELMTNIIPATEVPVSS